MMQRTRRWAVSRKAAFARAVPLGVVLVTVGLFAGCGSDAPADADGAESVTRGLLSAAGGNGSQRPSSGAGPVRQIPVTELGFDRGTAGAPIRIMELSDYGCGYCRRFHMETFPALREEFVETGIVEWKFVPYITGMFDNSRVALRGAECALEQSDEAFERLNHQLWEDQAQWKGSGEPEPMIRGWAVDAGVDAETYDQCHQEGRRLDRIASATELARELGVRGTPTFIVVGYGPLQGALPLETFQQILRSIHSDIQASEGDADR